MATQPQPDQTLEEAKRIYKKLRRGKQSATFHSAAWDVTWLGPLVKLYRTIRYGTEYPIVIARKMTPSHVFDWRDVVAKNLTQVRKVLKEVNRDFYRYARKVPKKFTKQQREKMRILITAHELSEYEQMVQKAKKLRKKGKNIRQIIKHLERSQFVTHMDPSVLIKESNYLYLLGDKDIKNFWKASRGGTGELFIMRKAGLRYGEEYVKPGSRRFKSLVKKMQRYRDLYFPSLVSVAYLYPERFAFD